MNTERLKEIESLELKMGVHASLEDGACVMELVSYVAGEPWSDHPKCACPILTTYAIALNDGFDDEHRQLLKPFIPLLVNTRATAEIELTRKRWLISIPLLRSAYSDTYLPYSYSYATGYAYDAASGETRKQLALEAIETLKMAIEIGSQEQHRL